MVTLIKLTDNNLLACLQVGMLPSQRTFYLKSLKMKTCLTLVDLQLLTAKYHHLSRVDTKRRSPEKKKFPEAV